MRTSVMRDTAGRLMPIVLIGLNACAEPNADVELRRFVDDAVAAAEARDTGHFRDIVADSYIDAQGNDRGRAIDLVRGFFLVNARIDATADVVAIEWSGSESARLVLDARIDGNMRAIAPRLELELLRDGSAWTVIGARWEQRMGGP